MISQLRVGIPITGSKGWLGGISHFELHVKAVTSLPKQERPQLFLVIFDETLPTFDWYKPFLSRFNGIIYVGNKYSDAKKTLGPAVIHCCSQEELFQLIDFYFPVSFNVWPDKCAASWIHDFQHKYLPELFPSEMYSLREKLCQYIAEQAKLAFFSSKAVESDFHKFYPSSKTITKVLALRIAPEDEWYAGNPIEIQEKYALPNRFVLCSNQFWLHKNHKCLFEAIAILKKSGQNIHLVCTGLTSDFRTTQYFEELKNYIKQLEIADLIHILGLIPRSDQIQLIRRSLFVIQPSLFEGLSLIVQECRTLGKAIILSDLDVHLEHEYGIYFNRSSAHDLAVKMAALLSVAQPGPDIQREMEAKLQALDLAKIYAKQFCQLVIESQVIFNKKLPATANLMTKTCNAIPIITSLSAEASAYHQQKAIKSWHALGFHVVSVNTPENITMLRPQYPDVEFVAAKRHACQPSKFYIYFDDLLDYIKEANTDICGIAEPDIFLSKPDLYSLVAREANRSFIYCIRTNIKGLENQEDQTLGRLGCCFFDKCLVSCYPPEEFCLGLPWWDYWAALLPIMHGIQLKTLTAPVAFHTLTPSDCLTDHWLQLGYVLSKYITCPFTLNENNITKYHQILCELIKKHSINIH